MLQPLKTKELQALRIIRNHLVHDGSSPSIRELMREMGYKFPRSATVLIERLIAGGYVRRTSAGLQILREPPADFQRASTVRVPLVGRVSCGAPIWAVENVEAFVPVATTIARPGSQYFILRAEGDSMNRAGINDGDLVLIRQQETAEEGDRVVALIDDEATIKAGCVWRA